jgi:hypothetical protein
MMAKVEVEAHDNQGQHWIGGDWGHRGAMVVEVVYYYFLLLEAGITSHSPLETSFL